MGWDWRRLDGVLCREGRSDRSRQESTQPWRCKSKQQHERPLAWAWSGTSLLTFPRPVALLADDHSLPIG